jgi:hypothetical protein
MPVPNTPTYSPDGGPTLRDHGSMAASRPGSRRSGAGAVRTAHRIFVLTPYRGSIRG